MSLKVLVKITVDMGNSEKGLERVVKLEIEEEVIVLEMVTIALKKADMFGQFRCIDVTFHDKEFDEFIYVEPKSKVQEKGVYKLIVEKDNQNTNLENKTNILAYGDESFNKSTTKSFTTNETKDPEVEYAIALSLLDNPWNVKDPSTSNSSRRKTLIKRSSLLNIPTPVKNDEVDYLPSRYESSLLLKTRVPLLDLPSPAKFSPFLDGYSSKMKNSELTYNNQMRRNNKDIDEPFNGPSKRLIQDISPLITSSSRQNASLKTTMMEKRSNIWLVGNGEEEEWTIKSKANGDAKFAHYQTNLAQQLPCEGAFFNSGVLSYSNFYESFIQPNPMAYYYNNNFLAIQQQQYFKQQQYAEQMAYANNFPIPQLSSFIPKIKRKRKGRSQGHKKKHDEYLLGLGIIPKSMKHLSEEEKNKKLEEFKKPLLVSASVE